MSLCDSMQAVFDRVEERATHNCYGRRDTYALSVDGVDVAGDDMDDGVIGALKLGDFLHSRGVDWWIINFDSHRLRMQYRHSRNTYSIIVDGLIWQNISFSLYMCD